MKHIIAGLLLTVSFAVPAFAQEGDVDTEQASSQCTTLSSTALRYRARDSGTNGEVTLLQAFLQDANLLATDPTGFFGVGTVNAVKAFQTQNNLQATGYVGPLTREKIRVISCNGTTSTVTGTSTGTGVRPTVTVNRSPARLSSGQTQTLSWSTTNATSLAVYCAGAGPNGNRTTPLPVSGSATVSWDTYRAQGFTGTYNCTWTATGVGGTTSYAEVSTVVDGTTTTGTVSVTSAIASHHDRVVYITGTGLTGSSLTVMWNGAVVTTTSDVSDTFIAANIPATAAIAGNIYPVSVSNNKGISNVVMVPVIGNTFATGSGQWSYNKQVCNNEAFFSRTVGLVKSYRPLGCAVRAGSNACLTGTASNFRSFNEDEWVDGTTVRTRVEQSTIPVGTYETYIKYANTSPVRTGQFTVIDCAGAVSNSVAGPAFSFGSNATQTTNANTNTTATTNTTTTTNTTATTNNSLPSIAVANVTIGGARTVTLRSGDQAIIDYSSRNGTSWASWYTVSGTCDLAGEDGAWGANTAQGRVVKPIVRGYAGCTLSFTYNATNAVNSINDTLFITVPPEDFFPSTLASNSPSGPWGSSVRNCPADTIYTQTTGLSRNARMKGCGVPGGQEAACTNLGNYREYTNLEWMNNTTVQTSVPGGVLPTGRWVTFIINPLINKVTNAGSFTVQPCSGNDGMGNGGPGTGSGAGSDGGSAGNGTGSDGAAGGIGGNDGSDGGAVGGGVSI